MITCFFVRQLVSPEMFSTVTESACHIKFENQEGILIKLLKEPLKKHIVSTFFYICFDNDKV